MIWLILLATTATQALASLATLVMPSIAPKIAQSFGLDPALIGVQVSLLYAGAMATSLFGGAFVRRWGATRTSQIALALSGLGMMTATLPFLAGLILCSLLIGMAYGMTNPAASHLLARHSDPKRRNLIFSIKQTGVPIGGTLAGLLMPSIAEEAGWRMAMVSVAAALLLLALLLQPARRGWDDDRDPKTRLRRNPLDGMMAVWRIPRVRHLSFMAFFFSGVQLCVTGFLVTMLVSDLGYALVAAGIVLSVVQVAGVAGRLIWGWTADRIGRGLLTLGVIGAVILVSALLTGLLSPVWPLWLVYPLLILFGMSAIGWNGIFLAEVARGLPIAEVSRMTGGALFFTFMGVMFGPSVFTIAHGLIGSYTATYALLGLYAAAGLAFLWLARRC
jgi:MFS family permease